MDSLCLAVYQLEPITTPGCFWCLGRYEGKLGAASVLNVVGEVNIMMVLWLVSYFNDFSDWYTTLHSIISCYEI